MTVSTAGDVTVQVTGALPSTAYVGNFCQYPGSDFDTRGLNSCFALSQTLTTDANGNGQLTFHFPRSGPFTGSFNFAPGGDTNSPNNFTTNDVGNHGLVSAILVPLSKANDGGAPGAQPSTQEPGSGTVSLTAGNVTIKLTGAAPTAPFVVIESFSGGGSASQQIGTLNTDVSGDASGTFSALSSTGTIFVVDRVETPAGSTAGLASGFTVP